MEITQRDLGKVVTVSEEKTKGILVEVDYSAEDVRVFFPYRNNGVLKSIPKSRIVHVGKAIDIDKI